MRVTLAVALLLSGCGPAPPAPPLVPPPAATTAAPPPPPPEPRMFITESGLKFGDYREGTGREAKSSDTVSVHYTGTLESGAKFDSSYDRGAPAEFPLRNVIKGWQEGIAGMKVGGKRKLIIPPHLGYGEGGSPPKIPGNSILHFDVELLGIK